VFFPRRGNPSGFAVKGVGSIGLLCRYLPERESGNAGAISRVFDSDAADVALSIDIQECVFVQIPGFGYFCRTKSMYSVSVSWKYFIFTA